MPYAMPKNMNVESAIKQMMIAEFKEALSVLSLSQGLHKEQFKQARKSLKRVRAALRLIRDSIPKSIFEREDETIRRIAKAFRDVRDAHVTEEVVQKLLESSKQDTKGEDFNEIRKQLFRYSQTTVQNVFSKESSLRRAIADLQAALERVDELVVDEEHWESLQTGLKDSYREVYDAASEVNEDPSDKAFVRWRKDVKYLRIHLDFLANFLSKELKEWNRELHRLSDSLGEYQDLVMLREIIESDPKEFGEKKVLKRFFEVIEQRQKVLSKECRDLGKALLSEPPKAFIRRISFPRV
jgi:CHAD domain-containing protein